MVVGGGTVGARKAEGLLTCGALVTMVSIEVGSEAQSLVASHQLNLVERAYESADLAGMWFVVTALDDPTVTTEIATDCAAMRLWMNAADDPTHCSAILPAVHRDASVVVAVSTGGASPATAGWIRDRIALQQGTLPGQLAAAVSDVRARVRNNRTSEGLPWRILADRVAQEFERDLAGSAAVDAAEVVDPEANRSTVVVANDWLRMYCLPSECATCTSECLALV